MNNKPLVMIKILRKHKGLTQSELAYKSKVTLLTIQKLENGWTDPYESKYSTLMRIANALNITVEDLFKESI